jgi:hypothetical protein
MAMKTVHYAFIGLAIVGLLYSYHMWSMHGTGKQALSGLGINRTA